MSDLALLDLHFRLYTFDAATGEAWQRVRAMLAALDAARGQVVAWYSVEVATHGSFNEAFFPFKPHDDGDWRPLYAAPPAAVPEGYALVSIDALRAWGRLDEVRDACRYPLAAARKGEG